MNMTRAQLTALHRANPRMAAAGMREAERDDEKALRNSLDRAKLIAASRQDAPGMAETPEGSNASGTASQPEIRHSGDAIRTTDAVTFTIPGNPIGKPRQTVSDKWKKRPCVMRYRAWADSARAAAPADMPKKPSELTVVAYIAMPASWSRRKKAEMVLRPHQQKIDIDNCVKAVMDALFPSDCSIAFLTASKYWSTNPRIEITAK